MNTVNVQKETVYSMKNLYSGLSRFHFDTEIILPDNKEDAGRIVKTELMPYITNKNVYIQGQTLFCDIDGEVSCETIYVSERQNENGIVTSYKNQASFSHTIKAQLNSKEQEKIETTVSEIELFCENITAKLNGPRKISVKCDICADAQIEANEGIDLITGEIGNAIEQKMQNIKHGIIVQSVNKDFELREKIVIPKEYVGIREILSQSATSNIEKCENKDGKTVFWGLVNLVCTYSSNEDEVISFFQPMEFTGQIETESFENDSFTDVRINIGEVVCNLSSEDPEGRTIETVINYNAEVCVRKNENISVLVDAFSTENAVVLQNTENELNFVADSFMEKRNIDGEFELKQQDIVRAEKVIETVSVNNTYFDENDLIIEGKANVNFLGIREEGGLVSVDGIYSFFSKIDKSRIKDMNAEILKCKINTNVISCEAGIIGNKCRLKSEISFNVTVYGGERFTSIDEIIVGEKLDRKNNEMILYFPDEKEDIWNVCKKYNASVENVMEINKISEKETLPKMIKII